MSAIPLAQYLSEFDDRKVKAQRDGRHRPAKAEQPVFERLVSAEPEWTPPFDLAADEDEDGFAAELLTVEMAEEITPPEPAVDLEAVREAAFCDGRESMRAEMEAVFKETLAAEQAKQAAAIEAAVAAARQTWVSDETAHLAEVFSQGLSQLEDSVKAAVSTVLRPVATGARRRQTVSELVDAVGTMTLDGKAFRIVARGPQDFLADFAEKLGDRKELVTFETEDGGDEIRIAADKTVIETRLSAWRRALEEALS
ncbi:hypothetical protein [Mangrovibrevibacter kandeliae]|uniref:hypothetical protein n=1 Tax=Mangrovibrevibacter kandeliae TaxID=2968473 RepID=UPI002118D900|nr:MULTISPECIES: hypothetical protein [unclassified Aurantimonas]MCQ8780927.1 hypothetical protein [Aurantimonas sp. CSK15Z-1]MCW4113708.1 hypothetical protein [Aurantimonas sp. MSK8Z-1]